MISQIFISQTCNFLPILNFRGVFKSSLSSKPFLPVANHPVFDYASPFSAVVSPFLIVTPISGCTSRLLWRTVWSAREPSRPSRMGRISCQTSTSWSANPASVNAGFTNTWVCLKMVSTPTPNGFADHYPY